MYVYVITNDGNGWISRGQTGLQSRLANAHRFNDLAEAQEGVSLLYRLIKTYECWRDTTILRTEILPDTTPERCVFCNDAKPDVEGTCPNCGEGPYSNDKP